AAPLYCCTGIRYWCVSVCVVESHFFLNGPAASCFYPLSLHDALPIYHPAGGAGRRRRGRLGPALRCPAVLRRPARRVHGGAAGRSEEHTSELQSRENLVCRLLLEKKKTNKTVSKNYH